jgi:hypothetical protein
VNDPTCLLAERLPWHECTTRDGAPLAGGKDCWMGARLDIKAARAVDLVPSAELGVPNSAEQATSDATASDGEATAKGSTCPKVAPARPAPGVSAADLDAEEAAWTAFADGPVR